MKNFIKQKLRENLNLSTLSLYSKVDISDDEKLRIKNLKWSDLILEPQNEMSPVQIKVDFPWESEVSKGIALDITLVKDMFYQIHISLDENLRGLGLGYKIYKAIIMNFGHVYSGKGRRLNSLEVPKIWDKLSKDSDITCVSNDIADMCVANNAPNKDELLNNF
jgi:hypothetical protein